MISRLSLPTSQVATGAIHLGSRRFLSSSLYSRRSSVMRVKADGEIEFTVTPSRASSRAAMTVNEAMPALAAP
ncbi:hypothetical protein D3C83_208060 [compost metagenome]